MLADDARAFADLLPESPQREALHLPRVALRGWCCDGAITVRQDALSPWGRGAFGNASREIAEGTPEQLRVLGVLLDAVEATTLTPPGDLCARTIPGPLDARGRYAGDSCLICDGDAPQPRPAWLAKTLRTALRALRPRRLSLAVAPSIWRGQPQLVLVSAGRPVALLTPCVTHQ